MSAPRKPIPFRSVLQQKEKALIAKRQEQEQAAVALAKAFASRPQESEKVIRVFLATLIREWDEASVQALLDEAAELAERGC